MKYFGGCDVGSTYTKAVILDESGKIVADTTMKSKINAEESAKLAMEEVCGKVDGIKNSKDLAYLIGTGYGRNKVPFADENISEISCHAMGVHVTDPSVESIIDIGGQDIKGIAIDKDGTVKNFAMNDKCAAGTGRFYEAMARSFEMTLPEFSKLSLTAKNVIPITAQCTVFAESEVITLVGEGKAMDEIAAGIQMAVAKRCFVMAKKAGATDSITLTGGCAKNDGLKDAIEHVLKLKVVNLKTDPQLMGALGAAEYARQKGMAKGA
ncbi:MAG: activase [Lachnospiraceae bacterium]|nr:activase [Lachnospiraceae bacterium]